MRATLLKLAVRMRIDGVDGPKAIDELREALDALLAFEALAGAPGLVGVLATIGELASDALLAHMDDWLEEIWAEAEELVTADGGGGDAPSSVSALPSASKKRKGRLRRFFAGRRAHRIRLHELEGATAAGGQP
jgi:hypothetical protein